MKSTKRFNLFYFVFSLLNSALLLSFKYLINSLSFQISDIFYIGNLLDLLPLFLIFAAILFDGSRNLRVNNPDVKLFLTALNPILISIAYFIFTSNFLRFTFFAGYSLNKELLLLLLTINYLLSLFLSVDFLLTKLFRISNNITSFLITVTTFFAFFLISLSLNIFTQISFNNKRVSGGNYVGVVLGAAVWKKNQVSPIFKGRLATAIHLFKLKKIKYIQLTGGKSRGEIPEALAAKNYLLLTGMPFSNILIETKTHSTAEQIKFVKNALLKKFPFSKLLIISDAFHLARVFQMANFFKVKLNGISSEYRLNWQELFYYSLRDAIGLTIFWLFSI